MGRREANKQAVHAALSEAARRLFAERGYEATSVREIAAAAGVTERTFYRYFDGKEGLLAEETFAWVEILREAIEARPVDEPPLVAARNAMADVGRRARAGSGPAAVWLFASGPPYTLLPRTSPRLLLRLEEAIATALRARARDGDEPHAEFRTELQARVCVAALRSAAVYRRRHDAGAPDLGQLLAIAFAELGV